MTAPTPPASPAVVKAWPYAPGCGPVCCWRDTINGTCDVHGPTPADAVVKRVTNGFKRDLQAILRSEK
jgi:hypothetical protein